jgi:Uma2 family endonuclease
MVQTPEKTLPKDNLQDHLPIPLPPTQMELPCDDGEPMETGRHKLQLDLLMEVLYPWLETREDGFVGGNMFVYYSPKQVKNQDFKGPDFFVVLGVPKGERRCWVNWEEEKSPDLVIELLSDTTAAVDKGSKKLIYQTRMRVPEYFWYDPFNPNDWAGFQLQGNSYQPLVPDAQGQLVSQILQLMLVRWQGSYKGVETTWLRWANLDGTLLPTDEERVIQAQQAADQAQQQAMEAQQRADQAETQIQQIARNLLQTGLSPLRIAEMMGVEVAQVETILEQRDLD